MQKEKKHETSQGRGKKKKARKQLRNYEVYKRRTCANRVHEISSAKGKLTNSMFFVFFFQ